jgi:predicted PurR-regulated permease PerM
METRKHHIALDLFVVIGVVFIAYILQTILVPLLFAILLSVLVYPIVRFLERKLRFNRIFSALVSIIILVTILMAIFTFIGMQLEEIVSKSGEYSESIQNKIKPLIQDAEKKNWLKYR